MLKVNHKRALSLFFIAFPPGFVLFLHGSANFPKAQEGETRRGRRKGGPGALFYRAGTPMGSPGAAAAMAARAWSMSASFSLITS